MSGYYPAEEVWKPIEGYESYSVSNYGKVKAPRGAILKEHPNHRGYIMVHLCKHNQGRLIALHRIVAKAFIPNPNNLPCINHKDEDKTNNHADNLEWCNNTYNQRYSHAIKVCQYDIYGNHIKTWDALSDIRTELGFATTNISKCCKGQIKSSNGYIFLYEGDSIDRRLIEIANRKHKGKTENKLYA